MLILWTKGQNNPGMDKRKPGSRACPLSPALVKSHPGGEISGKEYCSCGLVNHIWFLNSSYCSLFGRFVRQTSQKSQSSPQFVACFTFLRLDFLHRSIRVVAYCRHVKRTSQVSVSEVIFFMFFVLPLNVSMRKPLWCLWCAGLKKPVDVVDCFVWRKYIQSSWAESVHDL